MKDEKKKMYRPESALWNAVRSNQKDIVKILLEHNNSPKYVNIPLKDDTLLWLAYNEDYDEIFELLISNNADLDLRNSNGKTVLNYASETGNKDRVEVLLKYNASLETRDDNYEGFTALMNAVDAGNVGIAELLLKQGANPNVTMGRRDMNIIELAHGSLEMINLLLSYRPSKNIISWAYIRAIQENRNDDEMIKLLVKNGADIDMPDEHGETALVKAIRQENTYVVDSLLKKGANPNEIATTSLHHYYYDDFDEATALLLASWYGNFEIVDLLLKHGADPNVVIKTRVGNCSVIDTLIKLYGEVPKQNVLKIIVLLLQNGADVGDLKTFGAYAAVSNISNYIKNMMDSNSSGVADMLMETAIREQLNAEDFFQFFHKASRQENTELVDLLMKKIHDIVEIKINTYEAYATITYLTKNARYSEVSNLLMSKAKQSHLTTNDVFPILTKAVEQKNADVVELLMNITDIDLRGKVYLPVLMKADGHPNLKITELLLKNGLDVDIKSSHSNITSVLMKVYCNNPGLAKLFLEYGADPNLRMNQNGSTPLLAAVDCCDMTTIGLLLENGADPNIAKAGKTAIDLAILRICMRIYYREYNIHNNCIEIVPLLLEYGGTTKFMDQGEQFSRELLFKTCMHMIQLDNTFQSFLEFN